MCSRNEQLLKTSGADILSFRKERFRSVKSCKTRKSTRADLWRGCRGCTPPLPPEMTCGFLIQLVFCKKKKPTTKKKTMWFIGVEVERETRAPPPKKSPGSAPEAELPRGLTIRSLHHNNIVLKFTDIVKITFT